MNMPGSRAPGLAVLVLALTLTAGSHARADENRDAYLRGYVTALLEERFGLGEVPLEVRDGVLRIDLSSVDAEKRGKITTALAEIDGLEVEALAPNRIAAKLEEADTEEPSERPDIKLVSNAMGLLPREPLFAALIADPRWPRFSAAVQLVNDDPELETLFAGNFGATLPVYGWTGLDSQWQVGLQAGVFSIFDLESDSFDLVNSDFLAALPLAMRYRSLTSQIRLSHQSSHLGDEYLLRSRTERINLSFEELDLLLSLKALDWLRLYTGGGAIVRSEPDLDPWSIQAGFEASSTTPWIGDHLFPILAFDFQSSDETDWENDYSVRLGADIRTKLLEERRLQILFEYFNGHSPNGQFFERNVEHLGLGLHFFL